MKPKQIVTVFEDPTTETKPEGKAQLIRKVPKATRPYMDDGWEYWVVKFVDDGAIVNRTIKVTP